MVALLHGPSPPSHGRGPVHKAWRCPKALWLHPGLQCQCRPASVIAPARAQVLDCKVDALLHGPSPPSHAALPRELDDLHAQHSCFPHLAGSNPYLRRAAAPVPRPGLSPTLHARRLTCMHHLPVCCSAPASGCQLTQLASGHCARRSMSCPVHGAPLVTLPVRQEQPRGRLRRHVLQLPVRQVPGCVGLEAAHGRRPV